MNVLSKMPLLAITITANSISVSRAIVMSIIDIVIAIETPNSNLLITMGRPSDSVKSCITHDQTSPILSSGSS